MDCDDATILRVLAVNRAKHTNKEGCIGEFVKWRGPSMIPFGEFAYKNMPDMLNFQQRRARHDR